MAKKNGRPTMYSGKIVDKICAEIALGRSLRSICLDESMPDLTTVYEWLRIYPNFTQQYAVATDERTETQQEMLIEMGDKAIEHAEEADPKAAGAVVSAYKLKADNLKWSMSKMKPKKYGDKLDLTSDGKVLPTPIYGGIAEKKSE